MAELTSKDRKAIPTKEFAGPGRSYPIENRAHAINAKARAHQQFNKGRLSAATYHTILAKANRKLGKTAAEG